METESVKSQNYPEVFIGRKKTRQLIKSFEASSLRKRPILIKLADSLSSLFGSLAFLILNFLFFAAWVIVNSGLVSGIPIFDPFPFIFLTMTVSLEAIVLSIIVLISQKRQSQIDSLREELHLQINLIAEREITETLRLLDAIADKMEIKHKHSPELVEMLKDTDASYIERRLEKELGATNENIFNQIKRKLHL